MDPALALRPEFPGEPCVSLKINRNPLTLVTTVTTGVIASVSPIRSADIPTFSTRFAGFKEWRIVKTVVKFKNFSSNTTGLLCQWFDNQTYTPSLVTSVNTRGQRFNMSSIGKDHVLVYTPHDVDEQAWTAIGTDFTSGYIMFYTNNAEYGAPTTVTQVGTAEIVHTVQFRGFT